MNKDDKFQHKHGRWQKTWLYSTLPLAVVVWAQLAVGIQAQRPLEITAVSTARAGNLSALRDLIAKGADVNAGGADGATALLWACYHADATMAKALLAAGARPDVANRYGVTPLLQAARSGASRLIELLLDASASADPASDPRVETPLMAAARSGALESVRLIVSRGANVNRAGGLQQQTALMWASSEGHLAVVEALLQAGADPNVQARVTALTERRNNDFPTGGFTALMWAARNGHEDVARALVRGGADVRLTNGDGASAMVIAIVNDRFDTAKTLLDLGADPNDGSLYHAVNMHDATLDMRAKDASQLRWDHPNRYTAMDLITFLLDKGADPNRPYVATLHSTSRASGDPHNATPVYRAAVAADVDVLQRLLAKGADLAWMPSPPPGGRGRGGNIGRPALFAAAAGGRGHPFDQGAGFFRLWQVEWREPGNRTPADAVKLLLDAGVDPNLQLQADGNTVLHEAAFRNDRDVIRVLVAGGANLAAYNWKGQTPLNVAEENLERFTNPNAPPDEETLAAMTSGAPLPVRLDPAPTVALLRELLGWPPLGSRSGEQSSSNQPKK